MKHFLFGAALIFAALLVGSTLFGFVWHMVDLLQGKEHNTHLILWTYGSMIVGTIGWLILAYVLVQIDERDGVNHDDELDVTE